ncbi:MAG: 2-oxoglutarate dehydrogenase complex dihydrolipoyllysine-residue succinyltransferase [Desulfuromonadales bacterium]|nr:2-oxoglutarate dehydrogenase complex dihydrolipoyllysine-residue succinyltransferase [Desulfuromonadales bacterium]
MEIKIPEVGESVHEALVAKWLKNNGDTVSKDETLCEIETDKITLDLNAEASGVLFIQVTQGTTVPIGTVIGEIAVLADATLSSTSVAAAEITPLQRDLAIRSTVSSPSARLEMRTAGIHPELVSATGKGGRILPDDVKGHIQEKLSWESEPESQALATDALLSEASQKPSATTLTSHFDSVPSDSASIVPSYPDTLNEQRTPLSPLRRKIADRLLAARQQTAMLTSFNEADLGRVNHLREKFRDHFIQRHGVKLGLMPFFVKACVQALKEFPAVNARIDGNDIVYHNYYDIGIAVGAEKGLVVPILRNADQLRLFEIDKSITDFVDKIQHNRLTISDLEGGTFTISNGGVYGSLLSTPILNPPQSGVLGMHAIQERPVVRDGQIVIRPMMYLALSYDHRIIDGREAVGFLRRVKEFVEEPEELLLEG